MGQVTPAEWLPGEQWPASLVGGNHHMGTTRMSDDESTGVVDRNCRIHGLHGLYVAGSSVFPTSGYANPTLTIIAMALRLADHLRDALVPKLEPIVTETKEVVLPVATAAAPLPTKVGAIMRALQSARGLPPIRTPKIQGGELVRPLFTIVFLAFSVMQGQDAGRVYYERLAKPDLDKYTNSPAPARQQWFRNHFTRMVVFSPYFDTKTSWYPNALVYFNLYGIQRQSALAQEHADWILHDTRGNLLYVPWGCSEGACPQYAADIANPGFRAWWIDQARSTLSRGYRGLWIDDANMEFRVSDGTGKQVAPLDSSVSRPMSPELWRNHLAEFLEQIRKALPKAEIVHNSIWFAGPQGVRDGDPAIQRQIKAADHINVERGLRAIPVSLEAWVNGPCMHSSPSSIAFTRKAVV